MTLNDNVDDKVKEKWINEQNELKKKLITTDKFDFQVDDNESKWKNLSLIGGVDLSFYKNDEEHALASLVVLSYPDLDVVHTKMKKVKLIEPYICGFLAFREVAHHVELIHELKKENPKLMPQIIFVDGSGIHHHRGFGLASHIGVLADIPTIGIAKKLLCLDGITLETHKPLIEKALINAGDTFPLKNNSGKLLGCAMRGTSKSKLPVFVSIGHRISYDSAVDLTKNVFKHKIPEPIRQADLLSRDEIRKVE